MPEITFVFGPNNSFFFDSPKSWRFHNIPPTLRQLFNSSMSPAWRIVQPFCLALAPQINSPEALWYIGCRVGDGEEKIFYSQNYFDINYPELSRWQKTIPNTPRSCFVTFGQGYSYFASAPGHGSIWAGIPTDLSDKLQKAVDTPCCVALGAKNAWFALWPDGYCSWKFYGNYTDLDRILTDAPPYSISYLAISPYNTEQYFVAFRDRTVKYNFRGAPPEWINIMHEVFNIWQADIMQQQQQQQIYPRAPAPYDSPYISHPKTAGAMSPQTPNTPLPTYSHPSQSPSTPQASPDYKQSQSVAVEMPGSMPTMLGAPAPAPTPAPTRISSTQKRKSFFSKLF